MRSFSLLDNSRKNLIVEAMVITFFVRLGFPLIGVGRTQALLRRWAVARSDNRPPDATSVIRELRAAQRTVKRHCGVRGTCLVTSMSLWAMLLRRNIKTELRVGMRKRDGKIEGHAWLELAGIPINETPEVCGAYEPYPKPVTFDRVGGTL